MRLDVSSVLLQWTTGGLAFLWVTTRHRVVGLGYGWLLRGVFSAIALAAVVAGWAADESGAAASVRIGAAAGVAIAALGVIVVSLRYRHRPRALSPALDLIAPAIGFVGILATASVVGGEDPLGLLRLTSGMLLIGAVTDAMLLGHWYLVQPGLTRDPIGEIVRWCMLVWPLSFVAWSIPDGGFQVVTGSIDDGWGGLLGWTWLVCAGTTLGLVIATSFALRERAYAAVMAATGLLYLAILTAFGMDLVPWAVLAP